jgi:hypothetical protein
VPLHESGDGCHRAHIVSLNSATGAIR